MINQLRRLRLREGDIVVVRDRDTMNALMNATHGMSEIPHCPVVCCPGSIHRLSREYLQKLLDRKP